MGLAVSLSATAGDIRLHTTYKGTAVGQWAGVKGKHQCQWRFRSESNGRYFLDHNRSWCKVSGKKHVAGAIGKNPVLYTPDGVPRWVKTSTKGRKLFVTLPWVRLTLKR